MEWILGIVAVVLIYGVWTYNRLIRLQLLKKEAWSGIDVQLKRRHELIPNLLELVRGYSVHERETLEEVTRLRKESAETDDPEKRALLEQSLANDMKKLLLLVEAYPELRAEQSFRRLHEALVEVEDDLQHARRYFNGTVRDFNIMVESFPSNIIASTLKYEPATFFEVSLVIERESPNVSLA